MPTERKLPSAEETGYTDNGVELEQRESGGRDIEIYFPLF